MPCQATFEVQQAECLGEDLVLLRGQVDHGVADHPIEAAVVRRDALDVTLAVADLVEAGISVPPAAPVAPVAAAAPVAQ